MPSACCAVGGSDEGRTQRTILRVGTEEMSRAFVSRGGLSEKGTLVRPEEAASTGDLGEKHPKQKEYEGASRPGNEGAEANLRAEEAGKWGGLGLHLWAPSSSNSRSRGNHRRA